MRHSLNLLEDLRLEPADEQVVIAVAQAQYLAQQVRIDRVGRRTGEERAQKQHEHGTNVVLRMKPMYTRKGGKTTINIFEKYILNITTLN